MTPRKPVAEMSGSEVAAILRPLSREQLTDMLIDLSGRVPAAFEQALGRFGAGEGGQ